MGEGDLSERDIEAFIIATPKSLAVAIRALDLMQDSTTDIAFYSLLLIPWSSM